MEVGLIGLAGSGKTTLFRALTGMAVEGYSDKAHVGIADIPDPRLHVIAEHITTRKIIPANVRLVDIPSMPTGGDAKKLNALLEQIRQVDALCHVVRLFDDGTGHVDPRADIEQMETELALADLVVAESARERATRVARSGDADAKARLEFLARVVAQLEADTPIRAAEWNDADEAFLKSYGFVSAKPVLYVANVTEDDLDGTSPEIAVVGERAATTGAEAVVVCVKLEAELAELDAADRDEMLESLGLTEPAIGPLARAANAVLGLTTFYTAGDKEVRAWTIRAGAYAPEAAGVIHSDIQRGFIRAECYSVDDLIQHRTEKAIREAGKLRSEGKQYTLQDGDVVHYLFNV